MARHGLSALALLAAIAPSIAQDQPIRYNHGLVGYGIDEFGPVCLSACWQVLSLSTLNCSDVIEYEGAPLASTSLDCYATDYAFLTSLAWCIQQRCTEDMATIEKWWQADEPSYYYGDQPTPMWTYQESLENISHEPNVTITVGDTLNDTSRITDDDFDLYYGSVDAVKTTDINHETYGIILLVTGAALPILASLLRFLPVPEVLRSKFYAIFIDPPLVGRKHQVPWLKLAIMPTRGQAIFIAYLICINVILSGVGIKTSQPNPWYTPTNEILTGLANRTGVLSFANLPLLILYAGRNSILSWVTNWSQSTFLLLHRWVAYLCTLEAILHSLLYLQVCINDGDLIEESSLPYYIWGIVATLLMAVFIPAFASLPFRQRLYELFLVLHVLFAVFVLAGCYYHIVDNYEHGWGFETWLYVASAVWGFERVMRWIRIARNGVRTAKIEVIDGDYIRVVIDGVKCNGHAYLYFPTLTWRVWENHPFSGMPTTFEEISNDDSSQDLEDGVEKQAASKEVGHSRSTEVTATQTQSGITFFIRTHGGVTKHLRTKAQTTVLIESAYAPHPDLSSYDTVVCIAGGVGITAVLPMLQQSRSKARLYWSSRSTDMVDFVKPMLVGVDANIVVGERHQLRSIIEEEAGVGSGPLAIIVSGPGSMSDDVRMLVTEASKRAQRPIKLFEESFSW